MSGDARAALVTGAGKRRIGRYVADALAARGYRIALHYHSAATEAAEAVASYQAQGGDAFALQADLGNEAQAERLVQTTIERFHGIDVLVNCASLWKSKPLERVTGEDVRRHFEANVLGTFLCSRLAGLTMVGQPRGGCIVNFGDWAESRPYPDYAAYFASKGAIPTLTRCLAVELGTRNPDVRVNCILPGPVLFLPELPEEERRASIAGTLVKRAGTPENVVQTVLYLIDNDFVTGSSIIVDGGRTVYAEEQR